jgi:hypothetical protein
MRDWKEFENNLKKRLKRIKQETFVQYGTLRTFYEYDYVELSFDNEYIQDFLLLYTESAKDSYHWQYCTLDVYKLNFNKRFKQYKKYYPDSEMIDLINDELKIYEKQFFVIDVDIDEETGKKYASQSELKYAYQNHNLELLLFGVVFKMLSMTQDKKIQYLEDLKNKPLNNMPLLEQNEDFSDNSQIEKIVMLYELGIIDYLEKKLPQTISDATKGKLISKFSGITPDNARRYLSSIRTGNNDKNYPLKEDNINSVKAELTKLKLLDIFYPKESNSTK